METRKAPPAALPKSGPSGMGMIFHHRAAYLKLNCLLGKGSGPQTVRPRPVTHKSCPQEPYALAWGLALCPPAA